MKREAIERAAKIARAEVTQVSKAHLRVSLPNWVDDFYLAGAGTGWTWKLELPGVKKHQKSLYPWLNQAIFLRCYMTTSHCFPAGYLIEEGSHWGLSVKPDWSNGAEPSLRVEVSYVSPIKNAVRAESVTTVGIFTLTDLVPVAMFYQAVNRRAEDKDASWFALLDYVVETNFDGHLAKPKRQE